MEDELHRTDEVVDPVAAADIFEDNPQLVLIEEAAEARKDPMLLIRSGYLMIKDKKMKMHPLVLNKAQDKVMGTIRTQRIKKRPVRLVILKARQVGISTLTEGILYSFTSQRGNVNSLILSADEDGATNLFEMTKLYHEQLEANPETRHLAPVKKYSNEKKLEFAAKHSQVIIDTAKNDTAGRSYTFHNVHISEGAFFPKFRNTLLGVMQAVPDEPETIVIVETTANGEDNEFCLWWRKITDEAAAGTTDWIPVFISWADHEEYTRPFFAPEERENFLKSLSPEEKSIQNRFKLTLEQMNWRRWTIINKCGGSVDKFKQEYPLDPDEAFLATGRRVFGRELTDPQEKFISEPRLVGSVDWISNRAQFRADENGFLKVWEAPKKGHVYVVGADSSDGSDGGDPACAIVIDRTTWSHVATLHGPIPPDLFGQQLFALGAWYNWALVDPEANNQGIATIINLRDAGYPNIGHRVKRIMVEGEVKESDELGWWTSAATKPLLVSSMTAALRDILIVIKDKEWLREIKGFKVLDTHIDGRISYGAAPGFHDDRCMAGMIAIRRAGEIYIGPTSADMEQYRPRPNKGVGGY